MNRKNFVRTVMLSMFVIFSLHADVMAQDSPEYKKAIREIREQFGTVPMMFEAFPKYALAGAWDNFKQLSSPNSVIPPKYRELLQLAVAAQIPCQYCIYFHTEAAKAFGATEEEIQEAVAQGANTRHWSMILQGNQIKFEDFKMEFDAAMKYMAAQAKK